MLIDCLPRLTSQFILLHRLPVSSHSRPRLATSKSSPFLSPTSQGFHQVAVFSCKKIGLFVPRATFFFRPFQNFQITIFSCTSTGHCVPRAAILSDPLQ